MVHKIRGKVVRGNSIGRKLGFPTANIPVAAEMPVQDLSLIHISEPTRPY